MYKTVIFDLDGTLLNTLEDLKDSVNYVLSVHQYPIRSIEEIRTFVGHGIQRLMERAVPAGLNKDKFEQIFLEFKEYYTAHCQIKTNPYEGIMDLLDDLKQSGYQLAIVSNKNDAAVKALKKIYFDATIEVAIGQRQGVHKKPAPDTVFEAMRELKAEPGTTLYVGDSEVDQETADNAGIDYVLVDWGFRTYDELMSNSPKRIVHNCEELKEYICEIKYAL